MDNTYIPKVYIASFSSVDYDPLSEYGIVVKEPLTTGYVNLDDTQEFYKKLKPILEQTKPEDFLALSGSSVACCVIMYFWIRHHGIVRMLSFDKRKGSRGGYKEIILNHISLEPNHGITEEDNS